MSVHFSGQVILHVMSLENRYIPVTEPIGPSQTYAQHYTTIDVEGEAEGEDSVEEAALEEALAIAMAKRQGD